jgi:hypothetical protein
VSDCEQAGPLPAANGVIPTLVIATSSGRCIIDGSERDNKGIVFYDTEPVAWCCLADAEIVDFKTWAATSFPSVQIVTVVDPLTVINCPPTRPIAAAAGASIREQIRTELRQCGARWFVTATPTEVTQLVA